MCPHGTLHHNSDRRAQGVRPAAEPRTRRSGRTSTRLAHITAASFPCPAHPPFADPEPRIRALGLAVLRGPTITLLSPVDGLEEISNPFLAQE
jgi:hypothetical protein